MSFKKLLILLYFIEKGKCSFKSVKSSGDPNLLFLPTNLHLQKLHVLSSANKHNESLETSTSNNKKKDAAYCFVTMGSPTVSNSSYVNRSPSSSKGLKSIISSLKSSPSFLPQKVSTTAGLVLSELCKYMYMYMCMYVEMLLLTVKISNINIFFV